MRMYWALILMIFGFYIWPEQNISNVPFAALTLGLIAKTAIALYVWYWVFRVVVSSFEKDKFWPWRWTKTIALYLALRALMLCAATGVIYYLSEHSKWGDKINEYPLLFMIVVFIIISTIIALPDEELFGDLDGHKDDQQ